MPDFLPYPKGRDQVCSLLEDAAAKFVRPRFGKLAKDQVREKAQGLGLVTIVDQEVEDFLSEGLFDLDPASGVVGEEAVSDQPDILKTLDEPRPTWIIDPIDGTRNFAAGSENFCMMVARTQAGEILESWIYHPLERRFLTAVKGRGTRLIQADGREQELKFTKRKPLDQARGRIAFAYFPEDQRKQAKAAANQYLNHCQTIGSAGLDYWRLAVGFYDYVVFNRLKIWDHAAGLLTISEAGGLYRLINGKEFCINPGPRHMQTGLIAANSDLILDHVAEVLTGRKQVRGQA